MPKGVNDRSFDVNEPNFDINEPSRACPKFTVFRLDSYLTCYIFELSSSRLNICI